MREYEQRHTKEHDLFHRVKKDILKHLVHEAFKIFPHKEHWAGVEYESTKVWMKLFARFNEKVVRTDRDDLFSELQDFFIILVDSDIYYREAMNWFVEEIKKEEWPKEKPMRLKHWRP